MVLRKGVRTVRATGPPSETWIEPQGGAVGKASETTVVPAETRVADRAVVTKPRGGRLRESRVVRPAAPGAWQRRICSWRTA